MGRPTYLIISSPPLGTPTGFDSLPPTLSTYVKASVDRQLLGTGRSLTAGKLGAGFAVDLFDLGSFHRQSRFGPFLDTARITLRLKALLDEGIGRFNEMAAGKTRAISDEELVLLMI